jgi:hypothetical protein
MNLLFLHATGGAQQITCRSFVLFCTVYYYFNHQIVSPGFIAVTLRSWIY